MRTYIAPIFFSALFLSLSANTHATEALSFVQRIGSMNDTYESTEQSMQDVLPNGERLEQKINTSSTIWIYAAVGDQVSLSIEYPGSPTERVQTIRQIGPNRIRVSEMNEEVLGCNTQIEVDVKDSSFEFGLEDVKYDGADSSFCYQQWPYPLLGRYRWTFDTLNKKVSIEVQGKFSDLDKIEKNRSLKLEFNAELNSR